MDKKDIFKRILWLSILISSYQPVFVEKSPAKTIPHLKQQYNTKILVVDDKPFLILGGELSNSSASSLEYMKPIWPKLAKMNLNTVLVPVYWELIEPQEGKFDWTLVDDAIKSARKHNLRLILLWFGSWKNSMSCYVPWWVKTNQHRFPRARLQKGQALEILSAFSQENCQADARAFAALMRHLKQIDGKKNTVIMVQVENEIGMLTDARDHSNAANNAFKQQVPKELIDYLVKNEQSLVPQLRNAWHSAGKKLIGNWEEIFGKSIETDEIFMAWHYAKYTNQIAAAGKAEYPLPMFVNAALIRPNYKPGQYPSAGPLPHLFDIWRAAAPDIDFFAPDIYFDFVKWCQSYRTDTNPLFIPETGRDLKSEINVFYAIGKYDAMGFCPFAIDTIDPANSPLAESYKVLSQLAPLILAKQGTGEMTAVLLDKENQTQQISLGKYVLTASHSYTFKWTPRIPDTSDNWPLAGGIIISTAPDEYIIAGTGLIVTFASKNPDQQTGIISIDEGRLVNGIWKNGRRLNGDENHQGRHVNLPFGKFNIQRVKVYCYQ